MIDSRSVLFMLGLAATVAAQAQVPVSIAVRETEAGGGSAFTAIGANGGSAGGIEWINRDGQTLTLDGTWQTFTFNLTSDPILGFAGSTANSVLDGTFGTLEHVRVLNANGITDPITIWIDDVANTITDVNGRMMTTVFGDFERFAQGTEVMFQEPAFSGSTSGNINTMTDSAGVENLISSSSSSYRFEFEFVDGTTTRWVRLTTFNATNIPNPQIRFDQQSVITFRMRGRTGVCQETLGSQGPGSAIADFCGTGLNAGQSSTFSVVDAPAGALGLLLVSVPGQPDLSVAGGTFVSGTAPVFSLIVFADMNGQYSLTQPGTSLVGDLIWQSAFLDMSLPMSVTFTNAIRARFGQ